MYVPVSGLRLAVYVPVSGTLVVDGFLIRFTIPVVRLLLTQGVLHCCFISWCLTLGQLQFVVFVYVLGLVDSCFAGMPIIVNMFTYHRRSVFAGQDIHLSVQIFV